jgi:hypothetical protein
MVTTQVLERSSAVMVDGSRHRASSAQQKERMAESSGQRGNNAHRVWQKTSVCCCVSPKIRRAFPIEILSITKK